MKKTKLGINGFGRIGRQVLRHVLTDYSETLEVVAVNDLSDKETNAHLFKYDSTYGMYPGKVELGDEELLIDGKSTEGWSLQKIKSISERDPKNLPWGDLGVDITIESTGFFTDASRASDHLDGGSKKVIISAPAKGEDITIVMGVNHTNYDPVNHSVVSNASCTTNCVAPMVKVLHDSFNIEKALMSTIHAYTNDQNILDQNHEDLRRARSAANSIIPTTTGAAKAVTNVIPELSGRIDGMAYRVPVITGSVTDLTVKLSKNISSDNINDAYRESAQKELKGILSFSNDPLVSSDYIGSEYSCTIDGLSTTNLGDGFIKVVGWYDNEWAYAKRVVDLAEYISNRGL